MNILRFWPALAVILFCLAGVSHAQVLTTVDQRSLKGKIDSSETSPIVVHVEDLGYKVGSESFSYEMLLQRLDSWMNTRMPGDRVVAVTADPLTRFSRIVDLLMVGRKLEEDSFSFSDVPVKIVLEEPEGKEPKPGRLFLRVEMSKTGTMSLNGRIHNESSLVSALKSIFATRKRQRVFIQGSKDVDKTVFVKVPLSTTHDDFVKLLRIVHSSGAFPIGIQIDWLTD